MPPRSSFECASGMLSADAARHRLAPRAIADLDDIWRYSAERWSLERADRYIDEMVRAFELVASIPTLARERPEFKPPVRIHAHQSHVIVYALGADEVIILRVLGGRQDWVSILSASDA